MTTSRCREDLVSSPAASCSMRSSAIVPAQLPQRVPAPVQSMTSSTEQAPSRRVSRIVASVTPVQRQTYMLSRLLILNIAFNIDMSREKGPLVRPRRTKIVLLQMRKFLIFLEKNGQKLPPVLAG